MENDWLTSRERSLWLGVEHAIIVRCLSTQRAPDNDLSIRC